jgi:hypothetical protein
LLPDTTEKVLTAREDSVAPYNLVAILTGLVGSIPGLWPEVAFALFTLAGAEAIGSLFYQMDVNAIRLEIDNQYWFDLKKELYCALPEDGALTPETLKKLAWAVSNVPDKYRANQVLREAILGLSPEIAARASLTASLYEGDSNGCDTCRSSCELIPLDNKSQLIELGPNQWTLKVTEPSDVDQLLKTGNYQAAFADSCCQITVDTVRIIPTPGNPPPVDPTSVIEAFFLTDGKTDIAQAELVTNLMTVNNKPFSSFRISTVWIYDFEVDVTITNCEPPPPPLTVPQLFVRNSLGNLQGIQPDVNGDYRINYLTNPPIPDANGFRRYYLRNAASCCILKRQPIDGSGDLGIIPTQLRVYACGAGETYTEYSLPNDAAAISDFWSGETCFNSFALAPGFVSKIRLWSCDAEELVTVVFATNSSSVSETGSTHSVQVVLSLASGTLQKAVTVPILVSPSSTADSPGDYTLQTPSVTFPIGSTDGAIQTVNISINNDAFAETNQTIVLQLGTVTWPGTAGAITQHTVTITDDDTWCYEFDFTVSNGGWTVNAGAGNWVSGQGWTGMSFGTGGGISGLQKSFSNTFLTSVTVVHSASGFSATQKEIWYQRDSDPIQYHVLTDSAAAFNMPNVSTVDDFSPSEVDHIELYWGGASSYDCTLTSVTIRGTGTNPFGISNCT